VPWRFSVADRFSAPILPHGGDRKPAHYRK
jgi:hypothetical protein